MRTLLFLCCLVLATSCTAYRPTVAGNTSRKGINNVGIKARENRHF